MRKSKRALVAEDNPNVRETWTDLVSSWGFNVQAAGDGRRTLELINTFDPHVLLIDLELPYKNGIDILTEISQRGLATATIMVSGDGDIPEAVRAIKLGAYDYLRKPIDPPQLRKTLAHLCEELERDDAEAPPAEGSSELRRLIGHSDGMRRVIDAIRQVAPTNTSLIIQGDSGTGKELVARAIHDLSPRQSGPYIAVNCAALPDNLLESELFGHERGAFTGADHRRPGCFELANGGTLLLDEIGEMKPRLQTKLLRVLQERQLRRLGGTSDIALDVRVLAATNRNLGEAIQEGRLREDLYYRLNVFTIELPPLRERAEDIPSLVEHFVREFAAVNGKTIVGVEDGCLEALKSHAWPGNVRELRNVVERAVILTNGQRLSAADLPAGISAQTHGGCGSQPGAAWTLPVGKPLRDIEQSVILQTLEMFGGNRLKAAHSLRISPKTLYNKLQRYRSQGERPPVPARPSSAACRDEK